MKYLLSLLEEGVHDEFLKRVGDLNPSEESEELNEVYSKVDWKSRENLLSRIIELRIKCNADVERLVGICSSQGFVEDIRVLVYRVGKDPEGVYPNFDGCIRLSALEAAVVFGRIDVVDFLIQAGTRNKNGEFKGTTLFEYAYRSRQLGSLGRLIFWSKHLNTGIGSGDSWARVNLRLIQLTPREDLQTFRAAIDSGVELCKEKELRLKIIDFLRFTE